MNQRGSAASREHADPSSQTPRSARALVASSWVAARREPSHRSEMVTQWLCGEVLEVRERQERQGGTWFRCRGSDGYEAWVGSGGLLWLAVGKADVWLSAASAASRGTPIEPLEESTDAPSSVAVGGGVPAGQTSESPRYLPWGSRVQLHADGSLQLPNGQRARPEVLEAIVPDAQRPARFPPDGEAVVASALRWLGVPYLWGGRTEWGVDCSGFVQAVFGLHGLPLPRDSSQQREAGDLIPVMPVAREPRPAGSSLGKGIAEQLADLAHPGDLLFFTPEGKGITHVAISAGQSRIVHAAASNGCVVVDDLDGVRPLERRLRGSLVAGTRPWARQG